MNKLTKIKHYPSNTVFFFDCEVITVDHDGDTCNTDFYETPEEWIDSEFEYGHMRLVQEWLDAGNISKDDVEQIKDSLYTTIHYYW